MCDCGNRLDDSDSELETETEEDSAGSIASEDDPVARDAALAAVQALGEEERARRLQEEWLVPPTDFFFLAEDVTSLQKGENDRPLRLHVRRFVPHEPRQLKAAVFFCHGLHAHVDHKAIVGFLEILSQEGLAVFALDLPGNGYSEGEKCLVPSFGPFIDVLESFISMVMADKGPPNLAADMALGLSKADLVRIRAKPYFVMGESMGGLISLYLARQVLESPARDFGAGFRGAVLLCPALMFDVPPSPVVCLLKHSVARAVPGRCMPGFLSKSADIKPYESFKDHAMQELTVMDNPPFPDYDYAGTPGGLGWRHGMRWATAVAFIEMTATLDEDLADVRYPFLVLHNPGDKIVFFEGSKKLLRLSPSKDKTLVELPGARHALHANAPVEVARLAAEWMSRRWA